MFLLQEAMVAGPFMLIGLIAIIILIVAGFYVWKLIVKNNNRVADQDLTEVQRSHKDLSEEERLKFLKTKRTITFFLTTVFIMLLAAVGSCIYKLSTITFD